MRFHPWKVFAALFVTTAFALIGIWLLNRFGAGRAIVATALAA